MKDSDIDPGIGWDKNNPSLRCVADQLGIYPSDIAPYGLPIIDLDHYLPGDWSQMVIISALIKNRGRERIIQVVKSEYFHLFLRFLFDQVLKQLNESGEVSIPDLISKISEYYPPSDKWMLRSGYYTMAQILDCSPTMVHLEKAIAQLLRWRKWDGMIID